MQVCGPLKIGTLSWSRQKMGETLRLARKFQPLVLTQFYTTPKCGGQKNQKFHRVQSECKCVEESIREFPKGKLLASQPFIVELEVEKENCVAECRVNNKSIELCSLIMIHHLTLKTTTLTSWLHVCTQNKPSTSYSTVLNRNLYGSALTKSFYISCPASLVLGELYLLS